MNDTIDEQVGENQDREENEQTVGEVINSAEAVSRDNTSFMFESKSINMFLYVLEIMSKTCQFLAIITYILFGIFAAAETDGYASDNSSKVASDNASSDLDFEPLPSDFEEVEENKRDFIHNQVMKLKLKLQKEVNRQEDCRVTKLSRAQGMRDAERKLREVEEYLNKGVVSSSMAPQESRETANVKVCSPYKYRVEMKIYKTKRSESDSSNDCVCKKRRK